MNQRSLPCVEQPASQDWSGLATGDSVRVHHPELGRYWAVVDEKTLDSRTIWIVRESLGTRQAFDYREGVAVLPRDS
ncbi:hypothetical protein [Arthrobacter sp. CJ23]|uniref:hypothetical protein n=1 Tax=Arthrobacter sp. CJ23 TaxID=2972479 RepID=UPI00215CB892|nr:hypothetical protein [Arthrobacter sp. CJ23]UVJ40145.1 hypothetical protein NVV90_02845 [Arthrobacter sp. CJ23]